jgi:hypothetical protein
LIASSGRLLAHGPQRRSSAVVTNPAATGFRSTYRDRASRWLSDYTGKLLKRRWYRWPYSMVQCATRQRVACVCGSQRQKADSWPSATGF